MARQFMPDDAILSRPGEHVQIAPVCPGIAGLFMAPERERAKLLSQRFEHVDGTSDPQNQRRSPCLQSIVQIKQAIPHKIPVPRRTIRQGPIVCFDDIDRNDRSGRCSQGQRCMIPNAKIAFEPDHLNFGFGQSQGFDLTDILTDHPESDLGLKPAKSTR